MDRKKFNIYVHSFNIDNSNIGEWGYTKALQRDDDKEEELLNYHFSSLSEASTDEEYIERARRCSRDIKDYYESLVISRQPYNSHFAKKPLKFTLAKRYFH